MADIKPTRSELIKLKQKIKLAKSGYNLLKKKRDGLILEFFDLLKEAKSIRSEVTALYRKAAFKMAVARSVENDVALQSLALAVNAAPEVQVRRKNIMGVVVPEITAEGVVQSMTLWFISAIVLLLAFRQVTQRLVGGDSHVDNTDEAIDLYNQIVRVKQTIGPGQTPGRVEFQGSEWPALGDGTTIAAGTEVRIICRENIALVVEPISIEASKN